MNNRAESKTLGESASSQQVPSFLIGLVEDLALSNGLSVDDLYQSVLANNGGIVTVQGLEDAVRWLLDGTKIPWLAFEFGRRVNYQQLDVFGPLIASCGTIKEGLDLFQKYHQLLHPLIGLAYNIDGKNLCIRYSVIENQPDEAFYAEAILGSIPVWGERLTGSSLKVKRVWFRHAEPLYADKYREYFKCEVLFNQAFDAMWVDAHLLDFPILSSSPGYHFKIKEQAQTQLQSIETFSGEIKRIIRCSLPEDIGVEMVAKALLCSERTMQRKLAEENTSFKALKQEVRKSVAIELLETTTLSIEKIAFRLGYEQRTSFVVAFLRWTGVKPTDWKR